MPLSSFSLNTLRAFDAATGRILWSTEKQPRRVMEKRGLLGPRTLATLHEKRSEEDVGGTHELDRKGRLMAGWR